MDCADAAFLEGFFFSSAGHVCANSPTRLSQYVSLLSANNKKGAQQGKIRGVGRERKREREKKKFGNWHKNNVET